MKRRAEYEAHRPDMAHYTFVVYDNHCGGRHEDLLFTDLETEESYLRPIFEILKNNQNSISSTRDGDLGERQWGTVPSKVSGGGDEAAYIPQNFRNI